MLRRAKFGPPPIVLRGRGAGSAGVRADRWGAVAVGRATAVLLGFLLLPVVAIFSRVPPGTLFAQLHSPVALQALGVSLRPASSRSRSWSSFGTPAAYLLAQCRRRDGASS